MGTATTLGGFSKRRVCVEQPEKINACIKTKTQRKKLISLFIL